MNKKLRFTLMSALVVGAYLLSACGGTLPQSKTSDVAQKVQAKEIVFTGIVEAMNGDQWIVSGQAVTVDPAASLDSNIAVGDIVKVEGSVSEEGTVVALKIESSSADDDNSNDNNGNDDNTNDDNSNDDANSNDVSDDGIEVFGVVETVTADSITVNGVVYQFASFSEIKNAIAVGDQVKIHVIVNADGTFTIREIEKSDGLSDDDDNSNDDNGNDDNSNDDNGNDDNSNDDNGDNDNGNDDNSNDDDDGNDNDD